MIKDALFLSEHVGPPRKLIPILTPEERKGGVEYSNIMLKPEALDALDKNQSLKQDVIGRLLKSFETLGLGVVARARGRFRLEVFKEIYKKEINLGIIPDWEVERFSHSDTEHFIVKGIWAQTKTVLVKGKFICNPRACIYVDSHVERAALKGIFNSGGCESVERIWGSGCGLRGYVAANNLAQPDKGETDYTVYNWVHAPDPEQNFAVNIVIDAINNKDY